jgi:hypothetical protein
MRLHIIHLFLIEAMPVPNDVESRRARDMYVSDVKHLVRTHDLVAGLARLSKDDDSLLESQKTLERIEKDYLDKVIQYEKDIGFSLDKQGK